MIKFRLTVNIIYINKNEKQIWCEPSKINKALERAFNNNSTGHFAGNGPLALIMKEMRIAMAKFIIDTDSIPSEIIPGLYLGSIGAALQLSVIQSKQITHILSITSELNEIFKNVRTLSRKELHIRLFH